jgi:hypothetical protein
MTTLTNRILTPAGLAASIALTVTAYAVHTLSWVAHEIQGGAWPRWLELTYLGGLVVWVSGFLLTLLARSRMRRASRSRPVGDERTDALFIRAHQIALVVVLLAQAPFFFLTVPVQVLAQLTVTTGVVALFGSYAWLDR